MEPEVYEVCPYNPNHRMPACRLHYHLASCREKNPKIAKKMANCKYNACHVVPIKSLKEHEANCVNRSAIDDEPLNLQKIISPTFESNEKSNTANQISDADTWNTDDMHHSSFILRTFAPQVLVCESDSRDLKLQHPNKRNWSKGQKN